MLALLQAAITEGVIFLTYASLISASDQGLSRLDQLIEWCGDGYDGLIIFDEVSSYNVGCMSFEA